MVVVEFLSKMSPAAVQNRVAMFDQNYKLDWDKWIRALDSESGLGGNATAMFGKLLGKWGAVRPRPLRRCRAKAEHQPPFLEDLIQAAEPSLAALEGVTLREADRASANQVGALAELWRVLGALPQVGEAGCVGVSKGVMLLTRGKIGPALDRFVRQELGVKRPEHAAAWMELLAAIAGDIHKFEERYGRLERCLGEKVTEAGVGRLYDMLAGPKQDRPR